MLTRRDTQVVLGDLPDRQCADLSVSPSARQLRGPLKLVSVEPRAMQLLVALIEADGAVLSREALAGRLWGDIVVGDDALSRAVAIARRSLADAGTTRLRIETIPKVGYRLEGADLPATAPPPADAAPPPVDGRLKRRGLLAALAGAGALGMGWMAWRATPDDVELSVSKADLLLQQRRFGVEGQARALLEHAVAADPRHARAWGLLAVAWARIAGYASEQTVLQADRSSQEAAQKALALDRLQADALASEVMRAPLFGNWIRVGEQVARILEVAPTNPHALVAECRFLGAVGRTGASVASARAALAVNPANEMAQELLIHGSWATEGASRLLASPAFKVAGDVLDPVVRSWILALGGRSTEAEAHVREVQSRQRAPSHILSTQLKALRAYRTGQTGDKHDARDALLATSRLDGLTTMFSIAGLSALGFVDDAFAVAENWYGSALAEADAGARMARGHRTSTRGLFMPLTAAMSVDPRFVPLCRQVGLVDYWRRSAQRPDIMRDRLLPL